MARRRLAARGQRPHRPQHGALRGTTRSARRDGRRGPPRRLLADDRRDRRMTAVGPKAAEPGASEPITLPRFAVIPGAQVQRALQGREREILELAENAYMVHCAGDSVNPPSYFLRFPDRPSSRIIALPASIGGEARVDGLKWISSFPANVAAGI